MNTSLSPFAPENLVSRDKYGRPIQRQLFLQTQAESGASQRGSSRLRRRLSIYLYRHPLSGQSFRASPYYIIVLYYSLSGHAIAYRWRSLPRIHRHRASGPQGSSSDGRCLYRSPWSADSCVRFLTGWFHSCGFCRISRGKRATVT